MTLRRPDCKPHVDSDDDDDDGDNGDDDSGKDAPTQTRVAARDRDDGGELGRGARGGVGCE